MANNQEDVMINRRTILAGAAALAFTATGASAQEWKAKHPEITFAVIPAENASGVTERYAPFMAYLSKELGVKVNLRIANDYAAIIEGQRAGNIQIAYYGPASFARARLTGVKTDAFVIDVNSDGSKGYYSVLYVLANSPYQKLDDLKGKNLGLVDPNSTSGNNMPRFKMDQMGINPETYFSKVVFTGSHENAVLALVQGTVDVAANFWMAEDDSNLTRMLNKNMVKSGDGTAMKKGDFRIIAKSDLIINDPYAYLSDLPDDMKAAIRKAFLEAADKDKNAFDKLSDGKNKRWQPIANEDYNKTIELIKFVDNLRKKAS
jgi:phosphonate transport system substrate-binding protein